MHGSVDHDGTHDHKSAMQSKIVSVPLTRYSRTFGISMFDAQKGFEKTATQTAAVVNKIIQEITKDFANTVANTENTVTVAEVSGSTVAHTVSAAFGDYGDVESLVLNPQNYAKLIPDSALSLKLQDGAYGIGQIYKSALPNGVEGLIYNADAVACAFARPAWTELPGIEVVEFEIDGIPFRMKIEADGDTNIIYHTVDVLFGAAIANDRHIAKLAVSGN